MKPNKTLHTLLLLAALTCAAALTSCIGAEPGPRVRINGWLAANAPDLEPIKTSVPLDAAEAWMWPQVFSLAARADSLEDLALQHGALSVQAAGEAEQAAAQKGKGREAYRLAKAREHEEHVKEIKAYIEHFKTLKDIRRAAQDEPGVNKEEGTVDTNEILRVFKYDFPHRTLTEGPVRHLAFLFKGNKLQEVFDLADPAVIRLSETVDEAVCCTEMDLDGYILELDTALAAISE